MKKFLCAAVAALALCGSAIAAPIVFTFSSVSADVVGGPAGGVDLVISLNADTNNYQAAPANSLGGGLYSGLFATVSSTALGLSNVAVTNQLSLFIGAPSAGFPDFVGLSGTGGLVGLTSHPNTVGDLISNWNGISSFAASGMQTLTDGGTLQLGLGGNNVLGLIRIDGNGGPGQDGAFRAALVTPNAVPEPAAPALVMLALVTGGLLTRRGRARSPAA